MSKPFKSRLKKLLAINEYEKGYLRALNNIISVINTLEKEAEHGKEEN